MLFQDVQSHCCLQAVCMCTAPKLSRAHKVPYYLHLICMNLHAMLEYLPFSHFISFLLLLSLFSFILSPVRLQLPLRKTVTVMMRMRLLNTRSYRYAVQTHVHLVTFFSVTFYFNYLDCFSCDVIY